MKNGLICNPEQTIGKNFRSQKAKLMQIKEERPTHIHNFLSFSL